MKTRSRKLKTPEKLKNDAAKEIKNIVSQKTCVTGIVSNDDKAVGVSLSKVDSIDYNAAQETNIIDSSPSTQDCGRSETKGEFCKAKLRSEGEKETDVPGSATSDATDKGCGVDKPVKDWLKTQESSNELRDDEASSEEGDNDKNMALNESFDHFTNQKNDVVDGRIIEDSDDRSFEKDDDVENDAPVNISLKDSKLSSRESHQKQVNFLMLLKEKKKTQRLQQQTRNIQQQNEKRKSMVPLKLPEDILKHVDKEIDVTQQKLKQIVAPNEKIVFPEDSDVDDDDVSEGEFEDADDEKYCGTKIQACVIGDVYKNVQNSSAKQFLQSHFFGGGRINRQPYKITHCRKRKPQNCNLKWLKKRYK